MKPSCAIFWFKRDLRLQDNVALQAACRSGYPLLLVYVLEPSLESDMHYSGRHWDFVRESLRDLQTALKPMGTQILCVQEEVLPFFKSLFDHLQIKGIYSHIETGIGRTYQRDLELAEWLRSEGIPWREFQCNGVIRGLRDRTTWKSAWYAYMAQDPVPFTLPGSGFLTSSTRGILEKTFEGMDLNTGPHGFQPGGRRAAETVLEDFLTRRLLDYSRHISKPLESRSGCSRLSPYLAWGNLSLREVYQRLQDFKRKGRWLRQASAFGSRLRWHCHFIQKFEMEPRMEFEPVNRAFQKLEQTRREEWIHAWQAGQTGFPLVDAAMRCVAQTGYLNFRLRALVVSFLTHHLFQDFRTGVVWLARQFLDFEPGIHYGQFQMQAGLTGTNTLRVYNPTKNAMEHDPQATFIKKYVPELGSLPAPLAIEPWRITPMEAQFYDFNYGDDYPTRLVDLAATRKRALDHLYALRKTGDGRRESARILKKHTLPDRKNT